MRLDKASKSWGIATGVFFVTASIFFLMRVGIGLVWNDTPAVDNYTYDCAENKTQLISTNPMSFLKHNFFNLSRDGYRPLSGFVRDLGVLTFVKYAHLAWLWIAWVGGLYGLLAICVFFVSRRFLKSDTWALFTVFIFICSAPVISASWVIVAGLQPFVSIVLCSGLLFYWKSIESERLLYRIYYLVGLYILMLIGPWFREFCGLLSILIILQEIQRKRRPTILAVTASIFLIHAVFPMAVIKWIFHHASFSMKSVFEIGWLSLQMATTQAGATTNLVEKIWNSIRWFASWNFLVLFPPLLLILAGISYVLGVILGKNITTHQKQERPSRIKDIFILLAYLIAVVLSMLGIVGTRQLGFWLCLGIAIMALWYHSFLAYWFLLSFLPFLKLYTEHVHFAYAMVPASIILATQIKSLWSMVNRRDFKWKFLRYGVAVLLVVIILDQGATAYGSYKVVQGTYKGIEAMANWFKENVPKGSVVIANAIHGEDIRIYSKDHIQLFWSVMAGVSRPKRCVEDPELFKDLVSLNFGKKDIYLLEMDFNYPPSKASYHRHKYIHKWLVPLQDMGVLGVTRVRYLYFDPLRIFISRETIPFLGAPDLVNDFYTGPAQNGGIFMQETYVEYHLYKVVGTEITQLNEGSSVQNIQGMEIPAPILIEEGYKGYNIVSYNKIYYGLPQALGATDLTIKKDREKPGILTAKDQKELKVLVDKATTENTILLHAPTLIEEGYKGYNIIAYGGKYYALAQAEGAFDIVKFKNRSYKRAFEGNSVNRVKFFVNTRCQLGKLRKALFQFRCPEKREKGD